MDCRVLWGAEDEGRATSDVANQAAAAGDILSGDAGPNLREGDSQHQAKQPKETISHAVLLLGADYNSFRREIQGRKPWIGFTRFCGRNLARPVRLLKNVELQSDRIGARGLQP